MNFKNPTLKIFPFIQQTGMMECGTTALAMIFKYHGFYNIQRVLANVAQTDTQGTSLYVLKRIASGFGFKTEGYQLEFDTLFDLNLPRIAHYDGSHYMVIHKIDKTHIWIADPSYGKDKFTHEEFKKNGMVLFSL